MITVNMNQKDEATRVFHIEIPRDEVDRQFETIAAKIRRSASLPGFRKGKVPMPIINRKFSREIREEVLEHLVSASYREALEQTRSIPIQHPHFENLLLDRGKPFTYQMTVEVLPQVKVGNYRGLKLKRPKLKITDEQVAEVLEKIRQQNAVLTPVEARASQAGDVATIDFQGTSNGEPVEGTSAQDYVLEIGGGQALPEFENSLVGMALNETKTFQVTFPQDYHAREMANRTIEFSATLKNLREKQLAPLNDEFAKDIGPFADLEELKTRIRQDLEAEQEQQRRLLLKDQIVQQLAKITEVAVPAVLIERSLEKLVKDQETRLKRQNQDWAQLQTTPADFKEKNRSAVEFQWRSTLALREISLLEKIEPSREEVEQEAERLARMSRRPPQEVKRYLRESGDWENVRDRLQEDKTLDWIIQHAVISET